MTTIFDDDLVEVKSEPLDIDENSWKHEPSFHQNVSGIVVEKHIEDFDGKVKIKTEIKTEESFEDFERCDFAYPSNIKNTVSSVESDKSGSGNASKIAAAPTELPGSSGVMVTDESSETSSPESENVSN